MEPRTLMPAVAKPPCMPPNPHWAAAALEEAGEEALCEVVLDSVDDEGRVEDPEDVGVEVGDVKEMEVDGELTAQNWLAKDVAEGRSEAQEVSTQDS